VAGAPSAAARQIFTDRRLGAADGVIVVAVADKRVGVYLGKAFAARGVTDTVISERIRSDFLPRARQGQYARGASDLAQGLVQAGMANGGRTRRSGGGGFPWGLVVVVAVAGGAFWWWSNRSKGAGVKERLEALKGPQERIVSGAIKLAEVDQLARYKEGGIQRAYQTLGRESNDTLNRARAYGERFDAAESALKSGKSGEAEKHLEWLENETDTLEPAVAASITALDALEAGGLSEQAALSTAGLPRRMEAVSRKLRDLRASYVRELERGRQVGMGDDPRFVGALEDAQSYLTRSPVDLDRANKAIDTAEGLLERYTVAISEAEERRAIEAQARADQSANSTSTLANAAILSTMLDGGHHHHDSDSGWSGSGSSDSGWGGSSADESWGSGSDSSWDSGGGSSGDDNW
jgi:hypothetical protein